MINEGTIDFDFNREHIIYPTDSLLLQFLDHSGYELFYH